MEFIGLPRRVDKQGRLAIPSEWMHWFKLNEYICYCGKDTFIVKPDKFGRGQIPNKVRIKNDIVGGDMLMIYCTTDGEFLIERVERDV